MVLKLTAKEINVLIAQRMCNFADSQLRAFDESAGVDHFTIDEKLVGRLADLLGESPVKMRAGEPERSGQAID